MQSNHKSQRVGIIMAGGAGSRLYPLTQHLSKQLLPIYNKPMIYYSLSVLMLGGITNIILVSDPASQSIYKALLGDGSKLGLDIRYVMQANPDGLASGILYSEEIIGGRDIALILGDNLFYSANLSNVLKKADLGTAGCTIFAYQVKEPQHYGVLRFGDAGEVEEIIEKPEDPPSNWAVTGLYFYDRHAVDYAKSLVRSSRGELEITDLNNIYLEKSSLDVNYFSRGVSWLDTGTHDSLLAASNFVAAVERRQRLRICCPEEIAFRQGWINQSELEHLANLYNNDYGRYLIDILNEY